jgi:hypothetical protein
MAGTMLDLSVGDTVYLGLNGHKKPPVACTVTSLEPSDSPGFTKMTTEPGPLVEVSDEQVNEWINPTPEWLAEVSSST